MLFGRQGQRLHAPPGQEAFYPPPPFPLLHVDTTWKFKDMYTLRERMAKELGMELIVYHNTEAKELGINPFDHGSQVHTDMWKTQGKRPARPPIPGRTLSCTCVHLARRWTHAHVGREAGASGAAASFRGIQTASD